MLENHVQGYYFMGNQVAKVVVADRERDGRKTSIKLGFVVGGDELLTDINGKMLSRPRSYTDFCAKN